MAARQLSVEAQNSLNQWHRRRTLHCNQSRRSRNRRTIRRQACRDRGSQNSETDTERREERSGGDGESFDNDEEQQTEPEALQPLDVETHTPSDCNQRDEITSKQEERQMMCGEEDHR